MHEHHLTGDPTEMGRQYARQLAEDNRTLAEASPETLDPPPERLELARESASIVEEHAPQLLEELRGIADETGVDPEFVRTVPLALDAKAGCSVVAVSGAHTDTGAPLLARNHDFFPAFRDYATLYRTDPADGLASVGCSSVFVGRSDGINEAGLAVGFAEVPPHAFEPGFTWQLAIRAVLDTCESVDDAMDFLESIPHATTVNFLLADATGAIGLVEASPERVHVSRPDDSFVAATRQFPTESMREHQVEDPSVELYCGRVGALEEWFAERVDSSNGSVTATDLQHAMSDPDVGPCWPIRAEDPRSTIWSWVLDPDRRVGYLADDSPVETAYDRVGVPRG